MTAEQQVKCPFCKELIDDAKYHGHWSICGMKEGRVRPCKCHRYPFYGRDAR